ncbi:MAG TPA: phosphodiester glycosidase family protein [Armatimonadota bacterium]|jgi:exopolysaccharide biosynthesis protein
MILGYQSLIIRATTVAALAATTMAPALTTPGVVAQTHRVHGVTAQVVTVNLNDPHLAVTVGLARGGIGHSESMASMMRRMQPAAAITGTFFCVRSLLPVGDIVRNGRTVYRGPAGTGFCAFASNTLDFHPRRYGRTIHWRNRDTVLCTGPTLLRKGRNVLSPRDEGYRDGSLWALRPRTAVGWTRANKMLLVCVTRPIHLRTMTGIMKALGCKEALGLDGGSSCALYANGRLCVRPGRRLTNVLMVIRTAKPRPAVVARLRREELTRLARATPHGQGNSTFAALAANLALAIGP